MQTPTAFFLPFLLKMQPLLYFTDYLFSQCNLIVEFTHNADSFAQNLRTMQPILKFTHSAGYS